MGKPLIFVDDGFESVTYAKWNGGIQTNLGGTIAITNTNPHSGSYALQSYTPGGVAYSDVYAITAPKTDVYLRGYFRWNTLPPNPADWTTFMQLTGSHDYQTAIGIVNTGGVQTWGIQFYPNDAVVTVYPVISKLLLPNTYYCIELHFNASANGAVELWLDEHLEYSRFGDNFTHRGDITEPHVGGAMYNNMGNYANTTFVDDVVFSDIYNGPIFTEVSPAVLADNSAVILNYGARVRTLRHATNLSPTVIG